MKVYKPSDLSVLAYANNFTLWHYVTEDSFQDVCGPGYFEKAVVGMLRVGDMIVVNAQNANSVVWVSLNDGSSIKVS